MKIATVEIESQNYTLHGYKGPNINMHTVLLSQVVASQMPGFLKFAFVHAEAICKPGAAAHTWFLAIAFVHDIDMHVCVPVQCKAVNN